MAEQIFYEDVEAGQELPPLVKHPTTRQLVKWAGASGDFYEIHYDKDFAQAQGLKGVIVHGWLVFSFLGQLLTDWMGEGGWIKKFRVSYPGMNYPGEDIILKGKITRKYAQDGEHLAELEIWAENPRGEKTTPGRAVVALPSRKETVERTA
ncbi:MAG: dehydratase [Chloroflexi bacterium]|nr:dehydratase [Chloroflexota bacterium]